ncbi:hypothetical protein Xoosp13_317 [Xanthomonas phage Xoo-sp13]|nr:hypothetical protein Xoosp13_317 [Xanthomonas phage Xoo-sp13]
MNKQKLNETAIGGAVAAGNIAVRTDGPGLGAKERTRLQSFLKDFHGRVANRLKTSHVTPFPIRVNEAFDMQDVLSRLSGIEGKSVEARNHTTYGVEDSEGNVMKVTVRKDQAEEFEATLGHELADMEAFSATGTEGKEISMAELLYRLKDRFDIIDVEFPKIPTDVVYNADKATKSADIGQSNDVVDDSQANGDAAGGMGNDPIAAGGEDDEFGPVASGNAPIDMNPDGSEEGGEEGGDPLAAGGADLGGAPEDDLSADADGVEDFAEPEASSSDSILDKVLSMFKAQAAAQQAQAEAEAERYRAQQAEFSARAAVASSKEQEELASMELAMEKQKDTEKQAKKLADIAKFRVSQASGIREGEEGETVAMVRRQMAQLPAKWAILPTDDVDTRNYKNAQKQNQMRELQARMRTARTREIRAAELRSSGKNTDPNANSPQPNNQQQNGQQRAGQQQQQNGQSQQGDGV